MTTDNKNIRISIHALAGIVLMCAANVLFNSIEWLMGTLLIAGIACIGLSGALFIKATWVKNDANRNNKQWELLDSRLVN